MLLVSVDAVQELQHIPGDVPAPHAHPLSVESPQESRGSRGPPPSLGLCPCAISGLGSQQGPTSLVTLELGSCPNTATLEDSKLPTAFSQAEGHEPSPPLTTFM